MVEMPHFWVILRTVKAVHVSFTLCITLQSFASFESVHSKLQLHVGSAAWVVKNPVIFAVCSCEYSLKLVRLVFL